MATSDQKRSVVVVLDSVGVGAMPDAADWGDAGTDTLGHIARAVGGLRLPNLESLGMGNIHAVEGVRPVARPRAAWGRMAIRSHGKDTITGHWELAGLLVTERFGVFPHGFPPEVVEPLERATGRRFLANRPASGTVIIEELGEEHLRTGSPILYTSADSVLQIAAHERVIPVEELYRMCRAAFGIVRPYRVARVIARPFEGEPGAFVRTSRRRDFAIEPGGPTVLDRLCAAGLPVTAIGKIGDIYAGHGITRSLRAAGNEAVTDTLVEVLSAQDHGMIFANLVDFDTRYGHRRDPQGYAHALEAFDHRLPEVLGRLRRGDLLFLVADHGNDPTHAGTDHTREYVPLLAVGGRVPGCSLGLRDQLADVGATLAAFHGVQAPHVGASFLPELRLDLHGASARGRSRSA